MCFHHFPPTVNLVWDRCVGDLNRSLDQFSENKGCIIVIVNMFKMAPSCNKLKVLKILELLWNLCIYNEV